MWNKRPLSPSDYFRYISSHCRCIIEHKSIFQHILCYNKFFIITHIVIKINVVFSEDMCII